jgi:hypothetical protein
MGEKGAKLQTWVIVGSVSIVLNRAAALTPTHIYNCNVYDDLENHNPQ